MANHDRCGIGGYLSANPTRANHYQIKEILFFFP
jgi:hypothetical protein